MINNWSHAGRSQKPRSTTVLRVCLLILACTTYFSTRYICNYVLPFTLISTKSDDVEKLVRKNERNIALSRTQGNSSGHDFLKLLEMLKERLDIQNDAQPVRYTAPCTPTISNKPCVDSACRYINLTIEERLRSLLSPQFQLNVTQKNIIDSLAEGIPWSDVIIASAVSDSHYDEMKAMFKSLHETIYPVLQNFTVVVFDLGLTPHQKQMTKKNCRCLLIDLDFDLLPDHVQNLHCYSWKPLIVRAVSSKASTLVVWQDTSVRWMEGFTGIFERAALYGHQIVITNHADRVTANTLYEMFNYYGENPCIYNVVPEIANAVSLHRTDPLTIRAVLDPWARCSLEPDCMCPNATAEHVRTSRHCNGFGMHRCHRFDQSALSILMSKLYGDQRYRMEIPEKHRHVRINRGDVLPNYFHNQ